MTEHEFRQRYFAIDESYQDELGEEDYRYAWEWLQNVRLLFRTAAEQGRFVLFTVDQ